MALETSTYFPPLDKCLSGSERLISWQQAHRAFSFATSLRDFAENSALEIFFQDTTSRHLLLHPLEPFSPPSQKTKSDFETKTAPIHVPASPNGEYDLGVIKGDALWLSATVQIEECQALRIVILEHQDREVTRLAIWKPTDARLEPGSTPGGKYLVDGFADGDSKGGVDLGAEDVRRHRQLQIYTRERSHVLGMSTDLAGYAAVQDFESMLGRTWVDELARQLLREGMSSNDVSGQELFCTSCIAAIEFAMDKLDNAANIPEIFRRDESKRIIFVDALFDDIVSASQLLLVILHSMKSLPSHEPVLKWFRLMAKYNFVYGVALEGVSERSVQTLQCLIGVISVAILKPAQAINRLKELIEVTFEEQNGVKYPRLDRPMYFSTDDCLAEVNIIMHNATRDEILIASPAVYAWSLITMTIRQGRSSNLEQECDDPETDGRRGLSRRDSSVETVFDRHFALLQSLEFESDIRYDPPAFFAKAAVDGMHVYGFISQLSLALGLAFRSRRTEPFSVLARLALFDLLREGMAIITYDAEVVEASLAVLAPGVRRRSKTLDPLLANIAASDMKVFRPMILQEAFYRYPLELPPLLKMLTVLAWKDSDDAAGPTDLVVLLQEIQTMTLMAPETFQGYELDHTEDINQSVILLEDFPIFKTRDASGTGQLRITLGTEGHVSHEGMAIPACTRGNCITDGKPPVFMLRYRHSCLEYLGLLLCSFLPSVAMEPTTGSTEMDLYTASEVLMLINSLLASSLRQHRGQETATMVLERLSRLLPGEMDVTTVIFDLMENDLVANLDQTAGPGSLELLIASTESLGILTKISPDRIWSALSRSTLLGLASSGATALATIVGGVEVPLQSFQFLSESASAFSLVVDDAISGLARRKSDGRPAPRNRFDTPPRHTGSTQSGTIVKVVGAFTRVMVEAWMSLENWRFQDPTEKEDVSGTLLGVFHKILRCAHGLGLTENESAAAAKQESEAASRELADVLFPSADIILDAFASRSQTATSQRGFTATFIAALAIHEDGMSSDAQAGLVRHAAIACQFLTSLLRTVRYTDRAHNRAFHLACRLLDTVGPLVSLFAIENSLKGPVAAMLTEVVVSLNSSSSQPSADPPSLFSQISTETTAGFLAIVSRLDRPLCDNNVEKRIWTLLSSILSNRQNWLAISLLTGSLPRDRLKEKRASNGCSRGPELLSYALDQLSRIETLPPQRAIAMLEFVKNAQAVWVRASQAVRAHSSFLPGVLNWLRDLNGTSPRSRSLTEELLLANEAAMAAMACEVLACALHASIEVGDKATVQMLGGKLDFLAKQGGATAVDAYNLSLHRNLADNLARKFGGARIQQFARSEAQLTEAEFGTDFVYDTQMAEKILGYDSAWRGVTNSKGVSDGFAEEVSRANVNLSLVAAQRRLLVAWRLLATTLADCADVADETLQEELAVSAERCLSANGGANLNVPYMDSVLKMRADLAFVVLSKLVALKSREPALKRVLPAAWLLVKACPASYDVATMEEELHYFRTLLRVLFLAIQPHAYARRSPRRSNGQPNTAESNKGSTFLDPEVSAILVDVVDQAVASGFRALCGNLHTNVALALPVDFALITALLQTILATPGIGAVHAQLAEVVARSNLIRSALSLYSWSAHLAELTGDDPVYCELSLSFLRVLATIRPVAEQFALAGGLTQLASADVSAYFRKPNGKGPFDTPARMFVCWTEGFLPICLSLLDAVGPALAADVSAFLYSFPEQVKRANRALEHRDRTDGDPRAGSITLPLVSEAHSLCLLTCILRGDVARAAADGIDGAAIVDVGYEYEKVLENAQGLLRLKNTLHSRVVDGEPEVVERELQALVRLFGSTEAA